MFLLSVCRLWRNCARRVLRTQQHLTCVSACGPSDNDVHALCSTLAEEVEVNRFTCIAYGELVGTENTNTPVFNRHNNEFGSWGSVSASLYCETQLRAKCCRLLFYVLYQQCILQMFKYQYFFFYFASSLQKVFLLPKTVLAMVDCEAFNGQAFCYRQSKGWC